MKAWSLAVLLIVGLGVEPSRLSPRCTWAAHLASQEHRTPPGDWCQRLQRPMPKGAHPCTCHRTDCRNPDPDSLPAHTDPTCKNYCSIARCECVIQDCK